MRRSCRRSIGRMRRGCCRAGRDIPRRSGTMSIRIWMASVACAALLAGSPATVRAQQASDPAIHIGAADIGGTVSSAAGPEAGVWVIAETTELPTRFIRIVVTDERGRYLLPDLPKASYSVWVRGYGLVDSPKQQAAPGRALDLK